MTPDATFVIRFKTAPACTLFEAPPGLFYHEKTLAFKSEYSTGQNCDAYLVDGGEYFHGGAVGTEERNALIVHPIAPQGVKL